MIHIISTLVKKNILQPNEGTQNARVKVSDSLIHSKLMKTLPWHNLQSQVRGQRGGKKE